MSVYRTRPPTQEHRLSADGSARPTERPVTARWGAREPCAARSGGFAQAIQQEVRLPAGGGGWRTRPLPQWIAWRADTHTQPLPGFAQGLDCIARRHTHNLSPRLCPRIAAGGEIA